MTTQMALCLIIFVATLVSFVLNKIPMWLTSLLSLCALYLTKCVDADTALAGFSNTNTILMAAMFMVAAGFRRTSMVTTMVNGIIKITRGSFISAWAGYVILALLLTNFLTSPMVVYAIISPMLCAFLDHTGKSRSKYVFPLMVVCVACPGILPLATAIAASGQFTGFLEMYGFTGLSVAPVDFFKAAWPILVVVPLWAIFLAPKFTPEKDSVAKDMQEKKAQSTVVKLSPVIDKIGIILFFATIICLVFSANIGLPSWFIALFGGLLMCIFGVVDVKTALKDVPWDMLMLYVGALALGGALTSTGTGELIGNNLSTMVGGTHNSYILGALFFLIPFILTQFMLNKSVIAVFIPICLLTSSALGADPIGLMILVYLGACSAFLTPMATPAVPMSMEDGGYALKDLFRSGWLVTIAISVIYIFYVMTVFPCF